MQNYSRSQLRCMWQAPRKVGEHLPELLAFVFLEKVTGGLDDTVRLALGAWYTFLQSKVEIEHVANFTMTTELQESSASRIFSSAFHK